MEGRKEAGTSYHTDITFDESCSTTKSKVRVFVICCFGNVATRTNDGSIEKAVCTPLVSCEVTLPKAVFHDLVGDCDWQQVLCGVRVGQAIVSNKAQLHSLRSEVPEVSLT